MPERTAMEKKAGGLPKQRSARLLEQFRLNREVYISEPVIVKLPALSAGGEYLELRAEYAGAPDTSGGKTAAAWKSFQLSQGQSSLELFAADELKPGCYRLEFSLGEGDSQAVRVLHGQLLSDRLMRQPPCSPAERKRRMLDALIMCGQDTVFRAAALLERGVDAKPAEQLMQRELERVRDGVKEPGSAFAMVLFLCCRYRERLSPEFRALAAETAVRMSWQPVLSESRTLILCLCRYLAGLLFPDCLFPESGCMGAEVCVESRRLLAEWYDRFRKNYMSEWNAAPCIAREIHGLAILYAVSRREDRLHDLAARALNRLSQNLALYEHGGMFAAGSCGSGEEDAGGVSADGTTEILYVLFGSGFLAGNGLGAAALALSDYEAPAFPYRRPGHGENVIYRNTQGAEVPVNLYLYKSEQALLSTAVAFRPFEQGGRERVVLAAIDGSARVSVGHPGGQPDSRSGGMLPLAVQYRDLSILVYDIPETSPKAYTLASVPLSEFRFYNGENNVLVLEKRGGYIGLKALGGLELVTGGPDANREFISRGRKNAWLVKVSDSNRFRLPEDFLEHMADIRLCMDDAGTVQVKEDGRRFCVKRDGTFTVDGEPVCSWPQTAEGSIGTERAGADMGRLRSTAEGET